MAVNVSTITSICLYCKTNSQSNIEEEFHEICDEVGRELQLPTLVEKYFHINLKDDDNKKCLCGDCVNRLIELYDLEEHAKEEFRKEPTLASAKDISTAEKAPSLDEASDDSQYGNKQQCNFFIENIDQLEKRNAGDLVEAFDVVPESALQKEYSVGDQNMSTEILNVHENLYPKPTAIEKIYGDGEGNNSLVFTVEHIQAEDNDMAGNFADHFIVGHENESQELPNLISNTPIQINSSEAESQEGNEFFEVVPKESIEADNLGNQNNNTDEEVNAPIFSIEDELSDTEIVIINENIDKIDNNFYEELDETLMEREENVSFKADDNYDEDATIIEQKELFTKIASESKSSKTTIDTNETENQLNNTEECENEEVLDKTPDDLSNDSISLEEEYLIEEIICSEEYDEVDLDEYLDKIIITKFQDLELKWKTDCKLCFGTFNTFEELLNHSCIHELEEEHQFRCTIKNCDENASSMSTLARHLILHHYDRLESLSIYGKCPDCQKAFSNILDFNKHSCCRSIKKKTGSPNYCQYCDMDFQSLKRYVFHMQFHLTNRRPKVCLICGTLFKTSNDFFEHTQYQHVAEAAMACVRCDRFFKEKDVFDQHIISHDLKYQYSCTLCPKKYTNKFILSQHMDIYHSNKPNMIKCIHCEKEFVNRASYRNHIKCHDTDVEVEAYVCSTCGIVTCNLDNIKYHVESDEDSLCFSSHIDEKIMNAAYTCENCSLDFYTIKHLKQHRLSANHSNDLFICGICRQCFKTLRHMRNHCTNHKNLEEWKASFPITRFFVCNIGDCQEFYSIWTTLYYHKKRPHKNADKSNEEFKCQFCQQICSSKMSLAVHVARSHNNSNVKCSHCKRSFKSQDLLQEHIDRYHISVQCDICFKKFKHRRNLESHHNMVHLSIKRYFCKYCQKGYFHKSEKDIHEKKVHPKIAYKCELCNFATTYPESLQVHMDKHNNKLKFKCTICGKDFGRKQLLQCHMKRHLNKKDFSCGEYLKEDGCDCTFLTYNLLKKHIKTKHPNSTYNNNLQKDEKLKGKLKNNSAIEEMEDNSYELWEGDDDTTSEKSAYIVREINSDDFEVNPIEMVLEEDDLQFEEQ